MIVMIFSKKERKWIMDVGAPNMVEAFKLIPEKYQTDDYVIVAK